MDTLRVNICYRPLRIAWAIRGDDFVAYRQAVRYSHALWGGRHNPIIIVDREEEASRLIDLFRVDVILPIGDSNEVKEFPNKYPHLIKPFFSDSVFIRDNTGYRSWSTVLDVYNAMIYLRDKPDWKEIKDRGMRLFTWKEDDPLADVFLSQLGGYPSPDEVGTDYRELYINASGCTESPLPPNAPIPIEVIDYPSVSYLSRHGLRRHHSIDTRRDTPGFFVGSAAKLDDLVCHWNLRACDIALWFIDPDHLERYSDLIPAWETTMRQRVANFRHEWDRHVAIWSLREDIENVGKLFGAKKFLLCHVSESFWNGLNGKPPTMYFGDASVLGVLSSEHGKPKVSFALADKPFCGDTWFYQQHLVASVSFIGGLYGEERYTFDAPYLPELNEFYARTMHFEYDKFRIEPERIGIVIDIADHDGFVYALSTDALMEQVFRMAGFDTQLSPAGRLTRQLIIQLNGVQGARVFKIPGVRRLLKTHGPNVSLLKQNAIDLIKNKDPDNPNSKFSDHLDLHFEPRPSREKLTPQAVFSYLVDKGLYRIGAELLCPGCNMKSWIPLDSLKHRIVCDLCGHKYDATRQLVNNDKWHYKRSGVLGAEKNALGAIPVALTLQQLDTSLRETFHRNIYSPSLELSPRTGTVGTPCEVDFAWIIPRPYPRKTVVIVGECKDKGPITEGDVRNLKMVVDALPRKRFKTFVILSQIAPFTTEQVEQAKALNDKYRSRAILLTARELEPYRIYERAEAEAGVKGYGNTPEDMVSVTTQLYFKEATCPPSTHQS